MAKKEPPKSYDRHHKHWTRKEKEEVFNKMLNGKSDRQIANDNQRLIRSIRKMNRETTVETLNNKVILHPGLANNIALFLAMFKSITIETTDWDEKVWNLEDKSPDSLFHSAVQFEMMINSMISQLGGEEHKTWNIKKCKED